MKSWLVCAFVFAALVAFACAEPSGWGGYFQYANVPGWGQYEFGYNRGNHDHFTSRFEQGWGWKFKTKVRWGDKKGGYGEQYYDYQHSPKKGWGHGGHQSSHGKHYVGAHSENVPTVLKPGNPGALGANPVGISGPPMMGMPPQHRNGRVYSSNNNNNNNNFNGPRAGPLRQYY